jgi:hypothetical protein
MDAGFFLRVMSYAGCVMLEATHNRPRVGVLGCGDVSMSPRSCLVELTCSDLGRFCFYCVIQGRRRGEWDGNR